MAFLATLRNALQALSKITIPQPFASLTHSNGPVESSSLPEVDFVKHRVIDGEELKKYEEVVVIGDVHGCFDEMMSLLEKIHEKPSGDKLDHKK